MANFIVCYFVMKEKCFLKDKLKRDCKLYRYVSYYAFIPQYFFFSFSSLYIGKRLKEQKNK